MFVTSPSINYPIPNLLTFAPDPSRESQIFALNVNFKEQKI